LSFIKIYTSDTQFSFKKKQKPRSETLQQ